MLRPHLQADFKVNLEQVPREQGNGQNHCARLSRSADFSPRKNRRQTVRKRDKTVRKRDELTVKHHATVSKRRELTVKRRETARNRHELTVKRHETVSKHRELADSRRETVRKRREITVKRRETVRKRHDLTVTRREITVSSPRFFARGNGRLEPIGEKVSGVRQSRKPAAGRMSGRE